MSRKLSPTRYEKIKSAVADLVEDYGIRFLTFINNQMQYVRIRFTLAHEISHVWLEHFKNSDVLSDEKEGEANFFASYLLAPDEAIHALIDIPCGGTIAQKFILSDEAAELAFSRYFRAKNHNPNFTKDYDMRIFKSLRSHNKVELGNSSEQLCLVNTL